MLEGLKEKIKRTQVLEGTVTEVSDMLIMFPSMTREYITNAPMLSPFYDNLIERQVSVKTAEGIETVHTPYNFDVKKDEKVDLFKTKYFGRFTVRSLKKKD
jgi:hypothetical protein